MFWIITLLLSPFLLLFCLFPSQTIDCLVNIYLNYKYHNYQTPVVVQHPCHLTQIDIHNPNSTYVTTTEVKHLDPTQITSQNVVDLFQNCIVNEHSVVYFHFVYDQTPYILPCHYHPFQVIHLPPYEKTDLIMSYKLEYDSMFISKIECDEVHQQIITQYAGPKGDFYSGTPYQFEPQLMLDSRGQMMLSKKDDCLQLQTQLGHQIVIPANQVIKINQSNRW